MIVSIDWLKEFVEITESPDELADVLSSIGLEAEDLRIFEGMQGVVIGKVTSVNKHPNADRLSLTTVDIGDNENLQIVCGAPNVKAGISVPFAKINATLDNGKFKIDSEMMNLLGCTKENFFRLMDLMNYKKQNSDENVFVYKGSKKEKKMKKSFKKINNPFKKLESLSFK